MSDRNFFAELKRRNVYKVGVAYAVVSWLLIQIATQVFPFFEIPNWAVRLVILLLILGLPVALVLAWAFELTPEGIKRADEVGPNESITRRTGRKLIGLTVALAVIAAGLLAFHLLRSQRAKSDGANTSSFSDKSIAVLPFENLSTDQENAFFTDGVQDEILTDLARVADLKVISRTSVMPYKNAASRNLREIAAQLQVAHVVEGSVQRSGNQVRVTAQLIDARTDVHQWAMHYDRPLQDVFAIQSEIAQAIADQLRAHISPEEHAAMTQPPTTDVLALQLYQQAQDLESRESDPGAGDGLLQAVGLLQQAIERDPRFLAAHCLLVRTHLDLYWEDFDHTEARLEQARAALAKAVQLQPDAGETRMAHANYDYRALHDFEHAVSELMVARRSLPNSAEVPQLLGLVYRRQGRWDDAMRELLQAAEVDPRNFTTVQQLAFTCASMSRYAEATTFLDRALAIVPGDVFVRETLAFMSYYERGDLQPLEALNASLVVSAKSGELTDSAYYRVLIALVERNETAAKAALKDIPARGFQDSNNFFLPPDWYAGLIARTFRDTGGAQNAFAAARAKLEQTTHASPDYAEAWSALGMVDAGLGRKPEAIAEARHGCELLPVSKDAFDGPSLAVNLAIVYAWTGEKDLALDQLKSLTHLKGGLNFSGISYGALKHDVVWDPLRADPRFDKIVDDLAPHA